jgi:hypothetical protein
MQIAWRNGIGDAPWNDSSQEFYLMGFQPSTSPNPAR